MSKYIPFNKPFLIGNELQNITEAIAGGKLSGNGFFTKECHQFFKERFGYAECLLTTSCTDALEMCAILMNVGPGDEVIMPSFTFVSTANAFVLRGAKIVFSDSTSEHPNVDVDEIEKLITPRTKAMVVVHYAGHSCDMGKVMKLVSKYGLFLVEDAAQAIDSYYRGRPLGSFGHFSTFSFHETKNIISGEGGMLVVNDRKYHPRAEVIWEKGTNRSAFFRGEVDKYGWVDIGSSFLPSELISAFLYAQLENLDKIQSRRKYLWKMYFGALSCLASEGFFEVPKVPSYATDNGHMFYIVCRDLNERTNLIAHLRKRGILAVFHYLSLHKSKFYKDKQGTRSLPNSDRYSDCLLRLPLYYELTDDELNYVVESVKSFFTLDALNERP